MQVRCLHPFCKKVTHCRVTKYGYTLEAEFLSAVVFMVNTVVYTIELISTLKHWGQYCGCTLFTNQQISYIRGPCCRVQFFYLDSKQCASERLPTQRKEVGILRGHNKRDQGCTLVSSGMVYIVSPTLGLCSVSLTIHLPRLSTNIKGKRYRLLYFY